MEHSENISADFPRISAVFEDRGPCMTEISDGEWVGKKSRFLMKSRAGMTDPLNMPSFPLDRATPPAKKGGCWKPAKLTGFFLIKSRISSKYPIFAIFSTGVDALPLEPKTPSSVCQTERFTGLFEIHSCLYPHHLSWSPPSLSSSLTPNAPSWRSAHSYARKTLFRINYMVLINV
jgi:hypothetical protein